MTRPDLDKALEAATAATGKDAGTLAPYAEPLVRRRLMAARDREELARAPVNRAPAAPASWPSSLPPSFSWRSRDATAPAGYPGLLIGGILALAEAVALLLTAPIGRLRSRRE